MSETLACWITRAMTDLDEQVLLIEEYIGDLLSGTGLAEGRQWGGLVNVKFGAGVPGLNLYSFRNKSR
jgi:hypothetical protein